MKKMKKLMACLVCLIGVMALASGCKATSSMSYTYNVETGDAVTVCLDTTEKYGLSAELPFTISQDGTTLTQGDFMYSEGFSHYKDAVASDPKAKLIDSGTKDGNEYIFWNFDNTEYNYAVLVGESNTGIILSNRVSEESAKTVFERLTISMAE